MRLPWAVGLALMLVLAVAFSLLIGRKGEDVLDVPNAVLDYQEALTRDGAQSVRRGVNEGVNDVDELAAILEAADERPLARGPERLTAALREVAATHGRYQSLYLLRGARRVVARVGGAPLPQRLDSPPPYRGPGMHDAKSLGGRAPLLLAQFAPIDADDDIPLTVVGHYDTRFIRFALEGAQPGDAWVVNRRGEVVGALASVARLTTLPRRELREAAAQAIAGRTGAVATRGSIDRQEIIGYSPVSGPGPAGQYGWAVVTSRALTSFSLPATDARRDALLAGLVLGLVALIVFGWLYIIVLRPVLRLQAEAERLAYGDLSRAVEIVRYDEIGLIARGLERLRVRLIRARVRDDSGGEG